ncbi:MAG: DNA polymerase III subunit chi [Holosporales bacterium]|jgi:DNA polymerase-3 subunit chi|nr:DNA polymerase III subunit chi [Holosporales bacterium]
MEEVVYETASGQLDRTLSKLLEKAFASGVRAVVHSPITERVATLDMYLWTYRPGSFLPHAAAPSEEAALQPIWLTDREENPNNASLLVLLDTQEIAPFEAMFQRVFTVFPCEEAEGAQQALAKRQAPPVYWRQSPEGKWEQIRQGGEEYGM